MPLRGAFGGPPSPVLLLWALALMLACSRPGPTPKPTLALPTLAPLDHRAPVEPMDEASELEAALAAEVEQATAQARFLAGAPCDRLAAALGETPGLVGHLRGYAATLKSLAAEERWLERPSTQRLLQELDDALAELDRALRACGLTS